MPVTPLTTEARAVAARMTNWPNLSGNANIVRKLVYEDSVTINALSAQVGLQPSPPAGMVASLTLAAQRVSNVMECGGNIGTWPYLLASAPDVVAAAAFIEGT
jgi:hypothetical protein